MALLRCFFLVQITAKIANRGTPINRSVCLHSLFQPHDLLMQPHKFLLRHHVFMVVSEEPVFETAAFPNFIEKVRQGIPLVPSATEYILDVAGAAVGYDIVHIPSHLVQRCSCGSVFILAGQFLFPPRPVVDAEQRACGVELPQLSLLVRIIRLQNTFPDVMATGPTHGENPLSADVIKLAPHQVQDTGANGLHQAAVPLADWVAAEQIEIFMIPAYEQRGKRPILQPIQPSLLRITAIPDAAKVPADDETIVFRQVTLLMEGRRLEPAEITVRITSYKNCHFLSPFLFIPLPVRAPRPSPESGCGWFPHPPP